MLLRKSLVAGVLFAVPAFAGVAQKYDVIDLGTFCNVSQPTSACGTFTYAFGINDDGVIVGNGQGPLNTNTDNTVSRVFGFHPFAWSDNHAPTKLVDLGDFGKDSSFAQAINNSGLIVGYASKVVGTNTSGADILQTRAFKTTVGNTLEALPTPDTETSAMSATDVSDADWIVGNVTTKSIAGDSNFYAHGFVLAANATAPTLVKGFDEKRTTELFAVDTTSGLAVGHSTKSDALAALAINLNDPNTNIELRDLGGKNATAYAVNSFGKIVGRSVNAERTKFNATVFSVNADAISLGQLSTAFSNSVAYGINDAGLVVGSAQRDASGVRTSAFIYDLNASTPIMIDLNTKVDCASDQFQRWDFTVARGVNNQGEITGYGTLGGQVRSFLLRPSADQNAMPVQCAPLEPEFEDNNSAGSAPLFGVLLLPLLLLLRRWTK